MTAHAPNNDDGQRNEIKRVYPAILLDTYDLTTTTKENRFTTSVMLDDGLMEISWSERDAKKIRDALNLKYPAWKDNV